MISFVLGLWLYYTYTPEKPDDCRPSRTVVCLWGSWSADGQRHPYDIAITTRACP